MTSTNAELPIYDSIVEQLDFSPEIVNAQCKQLVVFRWTGPAVPSSKPRPGVKPVRRKARK